MAIRRKVGADSLALFAAGVEKAGTGADEGGEADESVRDGPEPRRNRRKWMKSDKLRDSELRRKFLTAERKLAGVDSIFGGFLNNRNVARPPTPSGQLKTA